MVAGSGKHVGQATMAVKMLRNIPDHCKNLIFTEVMRGTSMFLLTDTTGVTRPNYKDLWVGANQTLIFIHFRVENKRSVWVGGDLQQFHLVATMGGSIPRPGPKWLLHLRYASHVGLLLPRPFAFDQRQRH